MHGTVWMSSVNQKMLWSKHTSMMYTLPKCPCAQKTTYQYSCYLTEQVYETNIKVPLFMAKMWKKYGIQVGTNKGSFLSQKEIQ